MKNMLLAAAALAALLPTAASAQAIPGAIVAVVDARRILAECVACKAASAQLQSQSNALEARAKALQGQLQPEGAALETAVNALAGKPPTAALKTRIDAFNTRRSGAEQEVAGKQQALQSTSQNVQQQIGAKLLPIVNQVMVQRGANVVIEKNAMMANAATLEITDTVLAELNRQLPTVSVTPAAAAAPRQGR